MIIRLKIKTNDMPNNLKVWAKARKEKRAHDKSARKAFREDHPGAVKRLTGAYKLPHGRALAQNQGKKKKKKY